MENISFLHGREYSRRLSCSFQHYSYNLDTCMSFQFIATNIKLIVFKITQLKDFFFNFASVILIFLLVPSHKFTCSGSSSDPIAIIEVIDHDLLSPGPLIFFIVGEHKCLLFVTPGHCHYCILANSCKGINNLECIVQEAVIIDYCQTSVLEFIYYKS